MQQTFVPMHRYAKAFAVNSKVSAKNAVILCSAIRNKPLTRARRLLEGLDNETRTLEGKYYSNAAKEMLSLLRSCEKNAEFIGLDAGKLFVYASAHKGTNIRRRRRKGAFGNTMKAANIEMLLVERGRESSVHVPRKEKREAKAAEKEEKKREAANEPSKEHKKDDAHKEHEQKEHAKEHKHEDHRKEEHKKTEQEKVMEEAKD